MIKDSTYFLNWHSAVKWCSFNSIEVAERSLLLFWMTFYFFFILQKLLVKPAVIQQPFSVISMKNGKLYTSSLLSPKTRMLLLFEGSSLKKNFNEFCVWRFTQKLQKFALFRLIRHLENLNESFHDFVMISISRS